MNQFTCTDQTTCALSLNITKCCRSSMVCQTHILSLIYTTLTMATSRVLPHQFATVNHGAVYDIQHDALGYPHKPRVCLHVCSMIKCSNTGHPHQFLSTCTSTHKTPASTHANLDMGGMHRWGAWEKTLVRHSKWWGCGSPPGCPNGYISGGPWEQQHPCPVDTTTPMWPNE